MKKRFINFISLLMVTATVFTLVSCNPKTPDEPDNTEHPTSKSTTGAPVEIVEIPTDEEELAGMLNAAIEYVELYCYRYTKRTVCDVNSLNIGSFSSVSNAADAFRSIFGKKDVSIDYNYNTSRDSFAKNFPESGYTKADISSISANQVDGSIVITAQFPSESSPTQDKGLLHRMSNDFLSVDAVSKALADFSSSAASVSVTASDIQIKATISAQDSSLTALEVSYTQRYSLTGVTLVKVEGAGVTAASKTTVTYSEIGI